jgi:nucleoside-diphosphate-sugar epimerase
LITGATGFIGRHLVRRLLEHHTSGDIVCLVKASATPRENEDLNYLRNIGVRIIEGDLVDPKVSCELPPDRVDVVYHLAANIDTAAEEFALRVNDVGCEQLLKWLGSSLEGARLVYSSSIAVVDRSGPADGPLNESSPCVPRTEYGRTKLRGEEIVRAGSTTYGYTHTILRLATVYGPGAKIGGLFDRLIKDSGKHRLLARLDWPGRTSIVHVDDVASIMVFLAKRPDAANETYCIANPEAPTVGALAESIGRMVHPSPDPVHVPGWAWKLGRAITWSRSTQLAGAVFAQTTFWRLTLMVDDGFWFDTRKLQTVWTETPKDLVEGIAEMIKYL